MSIILHIVQKHWLVCKEHGSFERKGSTFGNGVSFE